MLVMDGAHVGVLKETDQVGLRRPQPGSDGLALEFHLGLYLCLPLLVALCDIALLIIISCVFLVYMFNPLERKDGLADGQADAQLCGRADGPVEE